jgi:hypothetical protein
LPLTKSLEKAGIVAFDLSFFAKNENKNNGQDLLILSFHTLMKRQATLRSDYLGNLRRGCAWADRGVRVNCISPGYVNTPMTQGGMANKEWSDRWMQFTPLRRVGESQEIAPAVLFLASDSSSFFTGSNFVVDGGYCCW